MLFKRKCKITFIRHGATINSEENRFFDDESYPAINSNGKAEMEKTAIWIRDKGLKIDKIFSSSALRCEQSARIISSICGKEFEILNDLSSRKMGEFNGFSFEEIEQKFPNVLGEYYKNPKEYTPKNAEALSDFNSRILNVLNSIIEQNLNKRLIIISHGSVIQSAVASALGIPLNEQFKVYVPTGSATQISYFEDFASLVYSAYLPI